MKNHTRRSEAVRGNENAGDKETIMDIGESGIKFWYAHRMSFVPDLVGAIKSIGFGSRAARTARRTWSCLSELLRRLEDEDAAVHGSTVVLFVLMLKEPTGHSDEVTSGGSRTGSSRLARSKGQPFTMFVRSTWR